MGCSINVCCGESHQQHIAYNYLDVVGFMMWVMLDPLWWLIVWAGLENPVCINSLESR